MTREGVEQNARYYVKPGREAEAVMSDVTQSGIHLARSAVSLDHETESRLVDVVLSDMSEPWPQTEGFWKRSLSDPYYRMMNTSGMAFRDHAGSMVLTPMSVSCRWLTRLIVRIYVTLHCASPSTPYA